MYLRKNSGLPEKHQNIIIDAFLKLIQHTGSTKEKCTQACAIINNGADSKRIISEFQAVKSEQQSNFYIIVILLGAALIIGMGCFFVECICHT